MVYNGKPWATYLKILAELVAMVNEHRKHTIGYILVLLYSVLATVDTLGTVYACCVRSS